MIRTALMVPAVVLALGGPLAAQWLSQPTRGLPRTADGKPNLSAPAPRAPGGKPDFTGLWNRISPKYSRNIAADLPPASVMPWADALLRERKEDLGKGYMNVLCVPLGPGYTTAADITGAEMVKIIQTPGLILMLNPDLTYRQIFMDGRALEADPNPSWMGYSVGRWDGDTLVVESNGYNDRTWLDHEGHPHTEALRVTERYRRRNVGHLDIDVTLSDPKAYAKPWTVSVKAELAPDTEMIEFVCGEKNTASLAHWVGKASDERKDEAPVAPEVLATYVGTYVEQPKFWRNEARMLEITIREGRLFGNLNGQGPVPLVAKSTTLFSGLNGLGVEFFASGLFVKHVSGDYRFARTK